MTLLTTVTQIPLGMWLLALVMMMLGAPVAAVLRLREKYRTHNDSIRFAIYLAGVAVFAMLFTMFGPYEEVRHYATEDGQQWEATIYHLCRWC